MRKFVMSLVMVLFMAGLVCAVEATLVKGDAEKKEVTVKEGDKETTYKYTDKLKVSLIIDKDGNTKEGTVADFEKRFKAWQGRQGEGQGRRQARHHRRQGHPHRGEVPRGRQEEELTTLLNRSLVKPGEMPGFMF